MDFSLAEKAWQAVSLTASINPASEDSEMMKQDTIATNDVVRIAFEARVRDLLTFVKEYISVALFVFVYQTCLKCRCGTPARTASSDIGRSPEAFRRREL